jgi:N-methylhydantoinase A
LRVGVDIGGTFTDLAGVEASRGVLHREKVLTTPPDPAEGVLTGLERLLERAGRGIGEVESIVHGTTLATNVLVERRGARTALVTTAGFRDLLEIGRERRFDLHNLRSRPALPLVARSLRFEVRERIGPDGRELEPLDEEAVAALARALPELGVESVAVCFLNSFRNREHELRAADILRSLAPGLAVTASCLVDPQIREYERFSTTVVNAYVQPLLSVYLGRLADVLRLRGYPGTLHVMLSGGGVGTAAGPEDLVAFDMGGTTAKICLVEGLRPHVASESEVARQEWHLPGSGVPVRAPIVDLIEIGTGGGSLARVDAAGLIRVGPRSAGAVPGPACYPGGGDRPTLTDADLVLGYLDAESFLGGELRLDLERARFVVWEHVARPLGLTLEAAAWGIHEIAVNQMALAARRHVLQRGADPASCALVALGGAGPVHADWLARQLRIARVVCPPGAGVASALGFLAAPLVAEVSCGKPGLFAQLDASALEADFAAAESEALALLASAGAGGEAVRVARRALLRYQGQGFELEVDLPEGFPLDPAADPAAAFEDSYRRRYAARTLDLPLHALGWRCVAEGPTPPFDLGWISARAERTRRRRRAWDPVARGWTEAAVIPRGDLREGERVPGPALVEEAESTAVVHRGSTLVAGPRGLVLVEVGSAVP